MKEFLLVFRMEEATRENQPSPEQMQANMKLWQDWLGSLGAQNKLVSAGNRLKPEGKVVRGNNVITDGPYVEIKEALGGYSIIKADTLDEATTLAQGCPILYGTGAVEVREIWPMD